MKQLLISLQFFLLVALLFLTKVRASENDTISPPGIEQQSYLIQNFNKPFKFKSSINVVFTQPPLDWIELAESSTGLELKSYFTLPYGFTLNTTFQSVFSSHQLMLGPHWNYKIYRKLLFSLGYKASYVYWTKNADGVSSIAQAWGSNPYASLAFYQKDWCVILNTEANIYHNISIQSENIEIENSKNIRTGFSFGIYIEQWLWNKNVISIGFINNFHKKSYIVFPTMTVYNRFNYWPQLSIGYVF